MTTPSTGETRKALALESLFDTTLAPVRQHPFPHAVIDDFFRPEVFQELKATFPQVETKALSKSSARGLYWGDPDYERHLVAHPLWRSVFEAVHSQAFIDHIARQFVSSWSIPPRPPASSKPTARRRCSRSSPRVRSADAWSRSASASRPRPSKPIAASTPSPPSAPSWAGTPPKPSAVSPGTSSTAACPNGSARISAPSPATPSAPPGPCSVTCEANPCVIASPRGEKSGLNPFS